MASKKNNESDGTNLTSGKQYELVCSGRFDKIDHELEETHRLLKEYSEVVPSIRINSDILNLHTEAIKKMEHKVFNGFGDRIDLIGTRMSTYISESQHTSAQLQKNIDRVEDRITAELHGVIKFGATSLVLIFIALISILGSIWVQDHRSLSRDTIEAAIHEIIDKDTTIESQ